ncbi:amidohydrolase family protein [Coraliomargarita akajimensis]|uniref:Amidohydrolase 2 n=1 Tax=Coraliomargarita akajimensis (strain DSM 45221 / IAM 15411 / JCM 23193 / KCTC 12865 / 04OKA010-24) TaxID=583355 RepID=D5EHM2_CORAD|nr:amidohydrolase family protein [Coraliomargarita akajimensis]ADE54063.1 amidohydrolase 2 [Coraliomargarita akajimensis DSM 45221]
MIIDSHTHCYPAAVSASPREWAETRGENHWADLVAPKDRKSIQAWASPEEMLSAMDQAGVDRAVLLGWYWENESTCRWHNQVIADWVETAPDRFVGFASVLPNANTIDQLEFAKSLGLRGVGELHFGVQQFDHRNPHWRSLADWCSHERWPVNFHATEAAGHDHPGSVPTPLNEFIRIAEASPELKIILAHWGGGLLFFEQNPRVRKRLRNVVYDTAASPLLYDMEIFRRALDIVGSEKIVYGSDYPLRIYPSSQKSANFTDFLEQIDRCQLSQAEQAALLGDTITNLLG